MKRFLVISMVVALVVGLILGGCAAPAPTPAPSSKPAPAPAPAAKPIEWKLVTFLAPSPPVNFGKVWADRVTEKSKGALTIKVLGGPEAIPRADQPAALQKGVVDAIVANSGMIAPLVPAIWCDPLARVNLTVQRKRGFYDFINKDFAKADLYYLGSCMANFERVIALKDKVEKRADLEGLKIRADEAYAPYLKTLGFSVVFMPLPDVYNAVDRRVVVGYHAVVSDIVSQKLYEVSGYWLDHPLLASRTELVLNLKSLNALPSDLRDLAIKTWVDMEPEIEANFQKVVNEAKKTMMEQGMKMKPIKLPPADGKWIIDTYYDSQWELVKKSVSPETYNKLQDLLKE